MLRINDTNYHVGELVSIIDKRTYDLLAEEEKNNIIEDHLSKHGVVKKFNLTKKEVFLETAIEGQEITGWFPLKYIVKGFNGKVMEGCFIKVDERFKNKVKKYTSDYNKWVSEMSYYVDLSSIVLDVNSSLLVLERYANSFVLVVDKNKRFWLLSTENIYVLHPEYIDKEVEKAFKYKPQRGVDLVKLEDLKLEYLEGVPCVINSVSRPNSYFEEMDEEYRDIEHVNTDTLVLKPKEEVEPQKIVIKFKTTPEPEVKKVSEAERYVPSKVKKQIKQRIDREEKVEKSEVLSEDKAVENILNILNRKKVENEEISKDIKSQKEVEKPNTEIDLPRTPKKAMGSVPEDKKWVKGNMTEIYKLATYVKVPNELLEDTKGLWQDLKTGKWKSELKVNKTRVGLDIQATKEEAQRIKRLAEFYYLGDFNS